MYLMRIEPRKEKEMKKMKKLWKCLLVADCMAALLVTTPAMTVLANELAIEAGATTVDDNKANEGIYGPESEMKIDDSALKDTGNEVTDTDTDLAVDDLPGDTGDAADAGSIPLPDDSSETEITVGDTELSNPAETGEPAEEEVVGGIVIYFEHVKVGTNVYATMIKPVGFEVYPAQLELTTEGDGTLAHNWKEILSAKIPNDPEWLSYPGVISFNTTDGTLYLPQDSSNLFSGFTSVTSLSFANVNSSKVTNMRSMFSKCESLEEINLSTLNTSRVTDMGGLFSRCYSLTKVNFGSINTSNVTNMSSMFFKCGRLTSLNLSKFNTAKVTDMSNMFYECGVTSLNLGNFNTASVTNMEFMFGRCYDLKSLNISSFNTANVTLMDRMFRDCSKLTTLNLGNFNTSKVTDMSCMFQYCTGLETLNISSFRTPKVTDFSCMFGQCSSLEKLDLKNFSTSAAVTIAGMFDGCAGLKELDISGFDISNISQQSFGNFGLLRNCDALEILQTPKKNTGLNIALPKTMYDPNNNTYSSLPIRTGSLDLRYRPRLDLELNGVSISGISLSYGYTGQPRTPAFSVSCAGSPIESGVDYTYEFKNNINPGTATLTITGIGWYCGTKVKTFEIVDCVSKLVSGKTYQLIPKNNSKTAVCPYSGKMVNNTQVYITDRSESEAMRFVAIQNDDKTWKFINSKCELALAVQQNSTEIGKKVVIYDQTTKKAQNWKLEKKSDNSFAISNAASGLALAMSDPTAVKGTTLSMQKPESSGLQRFYIVETTAVNASYDGLYSIRAFANNTLAVNVSGASVNEGANINVYKYKDKPQQKFTAIYSGGGYYRFVNLNSKMALTATVMPPKALNQYNVIQKPWAGSNLQRWKIQKNSDNTVTLINVNGNRLHLSGNKTADGTNVLSMPASTSKAQKWYLKKIA